ncbi:hypothetical protein G5I_13411 [Acromyrmex echinatior]|uniref:Uncharacterized protein n=1 Tax=Acromyrmex echinatior TaxID=103372 RepID=F4X4Y8_ACREC|nr:hypothetical protein G5I_13411 [Acromyrmex echinatior]
MDNLVKVAKSTGLSSLLRCLSKALLESGKKLTGRLPATLMPRYNVPRYFQPSSHAEASLQQRQSTHVTRGPSSVITNSEKDLVGQGKEAHVGSGDVASMPGLIPRDCSADDRSLRTPGFTDRLVGGGRRWLMLLSELYSDYTASARRLFARERSLFALPHSTPPFTTGEAGPAASRNDPRGGSSNERITVTKFCYRNDRSAAGAIAGEVIDTNSPIVIELAITSIS